jgi:tetratricopeptide (TPR) repeat protein
MSHRKRQCIALSFALALTLGLPPGATQAQPAKPALTKAQKEQLLEHYELGTRYYKLGKWSDAIKEYEQAYLISEDPVMLYNIAQSHRQWGQASEALRFYKRYLKDLPEATNRTQVEAVIAELERAVAEQKAAPAPAVPPAPVAPPAAGPAGGALAPPPVGSSAPSGSPGAAATGASAPAATIGARPASSSQGMGTMRFVGWTMVGVGGALLATSLVSGAAARGKADELEKAAEKGGAFDPGVQKAGKDMNRVAVGAGLLGIASGAVGGVLLFLAPPRGPAVAGSGGGATAARGSIYPIAAPGYAGAGARVTF